MKTRVSVCFRQLLASALVVAGGVPALANAEPNVAEIVSRSERAAYYAGDDGRAQARMMIVDGQGRKQLRQFTILRKDLADNGDQQMLVVFSRPTDVKNTVFRVEKHVAANVDDDRWLYLPALDLVKRISAGDKRTSFVGSHFFYEDVSGRATSEDNFALLQDTPQHYLLKATPKQPDSVEFAYYQVTIDKASMLPVAIEFFDSQGEIYRRVEAVKIGEVDGLPTVLRSKVSDLASGGYTLMEFRNIQYNLGLPAQVFSERSLRNLPVKWLK